MSPFEVDLGWKPKSPLDLLNKTLDYSESVEGFKIRLNSSLDEAKYAFGLAKAEKVPNQL